MSEPHTSIGQGLLFDGFTAARHVVTVICRPSGLDLCDATGDLVAHWPYDRLAHVNAPRHLLRLALADNDRLARLEISDRGLAHGVDEACPAIDRTDAAARAERISAVGWSLAAVISLLLVAFYGVPQIAHQLAKIVPAQVERSLGRAGDIRFRAAYDTAPPGQSLECGAGPGEAAGKAAFDKLIAQIAQGAGLTIPLQAVLIRRPEPNAFALAGGHVYVLQGLIDNAKDVDEVAAIIAHELGHVANRDGVQSILRSGGLSLIFGMLLGDFVGGGAVVIAGQTLLKAKYSRQQETAADDFAVRTLQELKADPRALATFLDRVARNSKTRSIFLGHPSVPERVERIKDMAPATQDAKPLLSPDEWQALRRICVGHT